VGQISLLLVRFITPSSQLTNWDLAVTKRRSFLRSRLSPLDRHSEGRTSKSSLRSDPLLCFEQ